MGDGRDRDRDGGIEKGREGGKENYGIELFGGILGVR